MAFKDRLKEARLKIDMSKEEFAQKLGVSTSAIGNYEAGASFPKTEILYKIFDILHTTPNFLFQDVVNTEQKTKEELTIVEFEFIKKYRKLDNISKDIVNYIVDAELDRANNSSHIISAAARGNSHIEIEVDDNKLNELISNYKPPEDL